MPTVDLSSYKKLYVSTAQEYVDALKMQIDIYLQTQSKESLEILHRSAHSLGSQSLVMGYKTTGELCRKIEYLFKEGLDGGKIIESAHISSVKQAIEQVQASVSHIESENTELDLSSVQV